MKHILHLEELFSGKVGTLEAYRNYLELTRNPSTLHISTKMDGAPAVLFGKIRDKIFVSTKSLFNNDPIYYHNEKEIDASILHDRVKTILKDLLEKARNANIISGLIYQADVLEHMFDNIYGANILFYDMKRDYKSRFIYIVHTEYCDLDLSYPSQVLFGPAHDNFIVPNSYYKKFHLDMGDSEYTLGINEELGPSIMKALIEGSLSKDKIKEELHLEYKKKYKQYKSVKGRSNCTSKYDRYTDYVYKISPYYIEFMNKLMEEKQSLINKLDNTRDPLVNGIYFIHDGRVHQTQHEGYVVHGPTWIKLVDRKRFSRLNQDQSMFRAWRYKNYENLQSIVRGAFESR